MNILKQFFVVTQLCAIFRRCSQTFGVSTALNSIFWLLSSIASLETHAIIKLINVDYLSFSYFLEYLQLLLIRCFVGLFFYWFSMPFTPVEKLLEDTFNSLAVEKSL